MKSFHDLLAGLPTLSELLPVTALVAVLVFASREVLEWRRRRASDKRKIRALQRVLARECELNYFAITRLQGALAFMQEAGVAEDASRLSISKRPSGGFSVMVRKADGSGQGGPLPGIRRDALAKHLVEIAGLHEGFFVKCEAALDAMSEADHIHQSVVQGPDEHFPLEVEEYYEGLIDYGQRTLEESATSLKVFYMACAGKELTQGRLR